MSSAFNATSTNHITDSTMGSFIGDRESKEAGKIIGNSMRYKHAKS